MFERSPPSPGADATAFPATMQPLPQGEGEKQGQADSYANAIRAGYDTNRTYTGPR
jgi:hypothetical protein